MRKTNITGNKGFDWESCYTVDASGCWLRVRPLNGGGYGTHRGQGAHRCSYERHVGPIPDDMTIDHLCRVRRCVNPEHLEVVTMQENNRRGHGASGLHYRATHCPDGHPYDASNTYIRPDGKGRGCKSCRRRRNAQASAEKSAQRAARQIGK